MYWKSQFAHLNLMLEAEEITKKQVYGSCFLGFGCFQFVSFKRLKYQSLTCDVPLYHFSRLHFIMIETVVMDTEQR